MTTTCIDCKCNSDYGGKNPNCDGKCGCHKWEGKGIH